MSEAHVETDFETYRDVATEADPGDRIPVELRLTVSDPYDAYRSVRTDPASVYLETTGGQDGWGYFATDPIEQLTAYPAAVARDEVSSPSLAALAARLDAETLVRGPCDVPYPCGLFGWLSYDVARELETLPDSTTDERGLPHLQFGVFDRVVAWREPRNTDSVELRITACPSISSDPQSSYESAVTRAEALVSSITSGPPSESDEQAPDQAATFVSDAGASEYARRVRSIKDYVRNGDTFQVNVSHRLRAPATIDPQSVYAALRRVNPAPYSGLLEFPDVDLVSASPELLLAIEDDRLITEPIAGTRPRGRTEADDEAYAAELTTDEKERAEHAMLVDLERNDLGKVSEYGSVSVDEYRRVDRYSEVMHLVSLVTGTLRSDVSLAGVSAANPLQPADPTPGDRVAAAIAAVFPGGTITGAPKPRTMEIIDELESTRRGPYTGSMGVLGFDNRATLNIVIRTLVRWEDEYHLRVGAGIVHDSVPEREYEETMDKARALITAMNEALRTDAELEVEG